MSETSSPDAAELQLTLLEADATWLLSPDGLAAVPPAEAHNRLGFGVLLGYFRRNGHFPEHPAAIPEGSIAGIAEQLGVPANSWKRYGWGSSTWRRHRREIRTLLGFRPCSVRDARGVPPGHRLLEQLEPHVLLVRRDQSEDCPGGEDERRLQPDLAVPLLLNHTARSFSEDEAPAADLARPAELEKLWIRSTPRHMGHRSLTRCHRSSQSANQIPTITSKAVWASIEGKMLPVMRQGIASRNPRR